MIQKMRAKVVWAGLFVVVASLFISIIPVKYAAAAGNYTWTSSSQIVSAKPAETYNAMACSGYDQTYGTCTLYNFGFKGTHPSNCTIDKVPDQFNDAAWPSDILKVIQVEGDGTGSGVNTKAPLAKLFTITGASGTTCNVSTTNITLDSNPATSSVQADFAYTDPNTIRQVHNGDTFKVTSDKTVYNQQYGTDTASCPYYIKLPSAGATTGVLNVPTDIHGSQCEYNNVSSDTYGSGPVKITIAKTAPSGIPADPHAADAASVDSCTIPAETTMRWLVCNMISLGQSTIELIDRIIQDLLFTPTDQIFTAQFKTAWNSFRVVGVVLVLLAGLVMVISQAAGLELFDAYTIKKLLPRLLVAAIGISLSWPLMKLTVTFFNDIGGWAHDLILYPFGNLTNHAVGSTYLGAVILVAALPATYLILGPFGSILLVGTIVLAIVVGLLVLVLRQIIILMAVLMAPLAIAAYVLPGTQKLWAFWKNTFLTSLLMFPIITGFIAAGKALALVAAAVQGSPMMHLLSVLAYIAPYFLLPFAFKLAGGLMSTIFSIANDRNKGAFDRLKKARQGAGAQHRERTIGRQVLQKRADIAAGMQERASKTNSRFRSRALRGMAHGVAGYNVEAQMSGRRAQVAKEMNDQIATGQDDEIRGLTAVGDVYTNDRGVRSYKTLAGAEVSEAAVLRGRQRWGNDSFAQQAALSYEMRKASDEGESQRVADNYMEYATSRGLSQRQALGNWIGAAFENQNQHLEYKNMRPTDEIDRATGRKTGRTVMAMGGKGYDSFVKEIYEKKGSYPLAQMTSNTIEELKNAHLEAEATRTSAENVISTGRVGTRAATADEIAAAREQQRAALDRQEKIAGIAETFMHSYGARGPEGEIIDPSAADATPSTAASAAGGGRQVSTPGAAHVAERVNELARLTEVHRKAPTGTYSDPGHAPTPNRRDQSGTL